MNRKLISIAAVALILALTACNKEEAPTQEQVPANAVQITASVGNPFTRSNPLGTAEEQAKFSSGDKILVYRFVSESTFKVAYELDGATWAPAQSKYLLWVNDVETFSAYYPVSFNNFAKTSVNLDQSTLDKIALSDLMSDTIVDAPRGQLLNFVMKRQTSRIIVNIAKFNAEFPADSKVADVRVVGFKDNPGDETIHDFIPYTQEDGALNSTYTLLLQPLEYDTYHIKLKVGEKEMRTAVFPTLEKGKSYTFNLVVGKEKLEIESITVADWTGTVTLPDDRAEETFYS